jgi:hypothetical protein
MEALPQDLGSQHVEAFRLFVLNWKKLELHSIAVMKKDPWLPGEIQQSICSHVPHHGFLKPEAACGCGIWSCKSRKALNQTFLGLAQSIVNPRPQNYGDWLLTSVLPRKQRCGPFYISARVEQWGAVIEHELGYRSEYARIIPQTIQVWPRRNNKRYHALVTELRRKYSA